MHSTDLKKKDDFMVRDLDESHPVLSSPPYEVGFPFEVKPIGTTIESLKCCIGLLMATYIDDLGIWVPFTP